MSATRKPRVSEPPKPPARGVKAATWKLLLETGAHPGHLKDRVTSPGGTAIAGLHTLEAGGLRTTLIDAVEAATKRARELGLQFLEEGGAS